MGHKFREITLSYFAGVVVRFGFWGVNVFIFASTTSVINSLLLDGGSGLMLMYILHTSTPRYLLRHNTTCQELSDPLPFLLFFRINAVSWAQVNGVDSGFFGDGESKKARAWLFFSFAIAFGCIGGALWIGIAVWLQPKHKPEPPFTDWPGAAVILQNILIFASAVVYRFAKPQVDEFGEPLLSN